jgi:hypothetical protein
MIDTRREGFLIPGIEYHISLYRQAPRHSPPLVQQPQLSDLRLVPSDDLELARPDLAQSISQSSGQSLPLAPQK